MNSRLTLLLTAAAVFGASLVCETHAQALGSRFFGQDGFPEHDFLQAIKIPFVDPKTQFFDSGFDGFPAFGLRPGSDIKSPYRLFMPEKLYGEFSIVTTVRPNTREGGFLFAVVNPLDTVVELGVQIAPAGSSTNISLMYTDVAHHTVSQNIASFVVPPFVKKWTRFALRVTTENITLFFNCMEHETVIFKREPKELVFDSASTLYVGQAGPLIKGAFDGALQELKLYGVPGLAEVQCESAFQVREDVSQDKVMEPAFITFNTSSSIQPSTSAVSPSEPSTSTPSPVEPSTSELPPSEPSTSIPPSLEPPTSLSSPSDAYNSTPSPLELPTSGLSPSEPSTSMPTPPEPDAENIRIGTQPQTQDFINSFTACLLSRLPVPPQNCYNQFGTFVGTAITSISSKRKRAELMEAISKIVMKGLMEDAEN